MVRGIAIVASVLLVLLLPACGDSTANHGNVEPANGGDQTTEFDNTPRDLPCGRAPETDPVAASGPKIYVVQRERGSLAVLQGGKVVREIAELGNLQHATVKFHHGMGYVVSRDGYLASFDPKTDEVSKKVKPGKSGIGFTFVGDFVAVANYDPRNVVILDQDLNTKKILSTDSRNVGIKATEKYLVFSLMDLNEIRVYDAATFELVHRQREAGEQPFDALLAGDVYVAGLYNEGAVGILNLTDFSYSKQPLRQGDAETVLKIPHFGTWGVVGDNAWIPGVGERKLHVVNLADFAWEQSVELIGTPVFVAVSPDGSQVVLNYSGDKEDWLTVIDTKERKVLRDIQVGENVRVMHLRFAEDGKSLYCSTYFDARVRSFDSATWEVQWEAAVATPSGIFLSPEE